MDDPVRAFYVLRMVLDGGVASAQTVTVRGHVPGLSMQSGTWFGFEGKWVTHKEYGQQLDVVRAPVLRNGWDPDTSERVLASHGVGDRVIRSIRSHFGDAEFTTVLSDPERLKTVPGLDTFTAMYVVDRWRFVRVYFQGLSYLMDLGLEPGRIRQVWSLFGDDTQRVLSEDPWALVQVDGITFRHADDIALRMGIDLTSPHRVRGAVLYACKNQRSFGHVFTTSGQLFAEVQGLIPDLAKEVMARALAECHKSGSIVLDRDTRPGTLAVYEPWTWHVEHESASLMVSRIHTAGFGDGGLDVRNYVSRLAAVGPKTEAEANKKRMNLLKVVSVAVQEWSATQHLVLAPAQHQGVINALSAPISILTGLPGTGKTTSLRAVVRIFQDAGIRFLLCAPTGIAAKNLSVRTGAPAYTIHRAFSARGQHDDKRESNYTGITGDADRSASPDYDGKWEYGPDNPYPADVVIIDEASMLDQHLLYRLLTCTSSQTRMVIVGDAAQLPSVGPGNVLRDLIASGSFPVTSLTEIFRQKDTSAIVYAAHAIHRGDTPECDPPSDFSLVRVTSDDEGLQIVLHLAQKLYDKRSNFQILSPRHAGTLGVTNMNARLRDLLNPQSHGLQEMHVGEHTVREGDRVMVVRNDYKLGVFNGDVGKIARLDRKAREIELKIFGDVPLFVRVSYRDIAGLIRLAYACTVHKAQGLEYDVIVMPLMDGFRHQLQRNLLYTAVTRARQKVILVGTHSALRLAVMNDQEDLRNTLFRDRIGKVGLASRAVG